MGKDARLRHRACASTVSARCMSAPPPSVGTQSTTAAGASPEAAPRSTHSAACDNVGAVAAVMGSPAARSREAITDHPSPPSAFVTTAISPSPTRSSRGSTTVLLAAPNARDRDSAMHTAHRTALPERSGSAVATADTATFMTATQCACTDVSSISVSALVIIATFAGHSRGSVLACSVARSGVELLPVPPPNRPRASDTAAAATAARGVLVRPPKARSVGIDSSTVPTGTASVTTSVNRWLNRLAPLSTITTSGATAGCTMAPLATDAAKSSVAGVIAVATSDLDLTRLSHATGSRASRATMTATAARASQPCSPRVGSLGITSVATPFRSPARRRATAIVVF
mmetsp:Transcript_23186/g.60638  ORF Transcript_23186/g.60638 Transcript_23186/m.60638 type:complete len:344 (-) Transcript_23186:97-1128(-)